jgi:siroheme synthase
VLSAATPDAETWIGTLDELASGQALAHAQPGEVPGTLVIGEVVSLAYRLGVVATDATDSDSFTRRTTHVSSR